MAMFPLGSVLFPHMPLPLRVFEPRYLALLAAILQDEPAEFGVVLIERGQEVGGGDARVDIGTVARVADLDTADETVLVLAQGVRRIEIVSWRGDDPFPQAEVRDLPEPPWSDDLAPLLASTEALVRRVLKRIGEFTELRWPPDVGLDDDPAAACWQLAAIAPLGEIDQLDLLRSTALKRLLERTTELVTEIDQVY
jgi:hypothetical protein